VLLGTLASLRWAELAALHPCDIDLDTCTIRVVRQLIEQLGGGSAFGPPKSRAGRRAVPFSDIIKAELADHLERLEPDDDQALVFTSPMGTPLRHSNFYRRAWLPAVAKAGLPGIHFHDLRHAGNTLTADAGASLRELMDRMGHSSTRAALIYQHSSDEGSGSLPMRSARPPGRHCSRQRHHLARTWHARPATDNEYPLPTRLHCP
jgi:integrase